MSLEGESKGETDPTINKVVLMGDEGVGKTSMFLRFKTGRFVETTTSTRYQAEHYKEWTVRGTPVKVYNFFVFILCLCLLLCTYCYLNMFIHCLKKRARCSCSYIVCF